jgi:hypothetical protein
MIAVIPKQLIYIANQRLPSEIFPESQLCLKGIKFWELVLPLNSIVVSLHENTSCTSIL